MKKLFQATTKVEGVSEPMVDWYESTTEELAKAAWEVDCIICGLPVEATVEFIEVDPKTLKPKPGEH